MTRDNAIFTMEYYKLHFALNEETIKAFDMAISALEREPSISGDGTLIVKVEDGSKVGRVFVSGDDHFGGLYYSDQEPCVNSPEKTNKTGHWIDDGQYAEGHSEHAYRCSECGKTFLGYIGTYKECPYCKVTMEELTIKGRYSND